VLLSSCQVDLGLLKGSVELATKAGESILFIGTDISPALLSVGYIVKLQVGILVLAGSLIGWTLVIPFIATPEGMEAASALDIAWTLWSTKIRYLGVGAMLVGGVWSIISVRKGVMSGLKGLKGAVGSESEKAVDLGLWPILMLFLTCFMIMLFLYNHLIGNFGVSFFTTLIMIFSSFVFVAVSSYVCGLVGSSNNPVSGMTISALLVTASLFLIMGFKGDNAILATLGVAAVVCCAACTAGDCSQDLKTGSLIGARPRSQQIAQVIGVVIPAFTIAPVLHLLHSQYVIGEGLKAPQATLFKSIAEGLFGGGNLPYDFIIAGVILGIIVVFLDKLVFEKKGGFRLYIMPIAVGIYLPITLNVPIFLGALIRHFVDKSRHASQDDGSDNGTLLSSGLIAGEAIMGVLIALVMYYSIDLKMNVLGNTVSEIVSLFALAGVGYFLFKVAKRS
jgi:putative OPT family oligopeptide transporter